MSAKPVPPRPGRGAAARAVLLEQARNKKDRTMTRAERFCQRSRQAIAGSQM